GVNKPIQQTTPAVITPAAAPRALPPIDESSFASAYAGPSVRKLARELGVNLGQVKGSGNKGRITADNVKAFVKSILSGQVSLGTASALPEVPKVDFSKFGEVEVKPLSRIQKLSSKYLHASWVNIPHVTQNDTADITDMDNLRKALKPAALEQGARLTPLAFLIKAAVNVLKEFPAFNGSLAADGENMVYKNYYHIGFAADTPKGLVVPVIKNADQKNLFEIAKEMGELSEKARAGKLGAKDMQGGTFTISSLGSIGGTFFTPIINAPEVAILGVARSKMEPVWDGENFQPRNILPLSLSYDHRVIDGANAVRFTTALAKELENADGLNDTGVSP
ncbi:MAG: dihydrolipoamide acetyltransferase, partial [Gammaproteobacteria bacterium]|nr:dihydrolipoamide acetyltransferase [Gammaproteobacteria bacterium]